MGMIFGAPNCRFLADDEGCRVWICAVAVECHRGGSPGLTPSGFRSPWLTASMQPSLLGVLRAQLDESVAVLAERAVDELSRKGNGALDNR